MKEPGLTSSLTHSTTCRRSGLSSRKREATLSTRRIFDTTLSWTFSSYQPRKTPPRLQVSLKDSLRSRRMLAAPLRHVCLSTPLVRRVKRWLGDRRLQVADGWSSIDAAAAEKRAAVVSCPRRCPVSRHRIIQIAKLWQAATIYRACRQISRALWEIQRTE